MQCFRKRPFRSGVVRATRATSSMDGRSVESCLPIPLQDLCLLVVINDLNVYPVSLLASLPRWLRRRLLSNLPIIDLCLLDHSAVANGIDINEIWKIRYPPCASRGLRSLFLVSEHWLDYSRFELPLKRWRVSGHATVNSARELEGLEPKLELALQSLPRGVRYGKHIEDHRTECLTQIALGLLYNCESKYLYESRDDNREIPLIVPKAIARECVSINGNVLLQELTNAWHIPYRDTPTYTKRGPCTGVGQKYYLLWKQQGIPLSKQIGVDVEITPKRYELIRNRADRSELITLITQCFGLKAPSIHLDLHKLKPQSGPEVRSLLKYLLSDVQILGLYSSDTFGQIKSYAKQDISISTIMEMCVGSGRECQLGALFYNLDRIDIRRLSPHIYTQPGDNRQPYYSGLSVLECVWIRSRLELIHIVRLIQQHSSLKYVSFQVFGKGVTDSDYPDSAQFFTALASLFQRPHFQVLHLDCHVINAHLLTLLVHGFMTAPCSRSQQLSISISDHMPRNYLFKVSLPHIKQCLKTVPDCGVQHKRLLFDTSGHDFKIILASFSILESLLQFPTIRLKDLMFECVPDASGNYPLLHYAALHPDLLVSAISFHFNRGFSQQFLLAIQEDFRKLFSMSTLKEISIDGYWEEFPEIKHALVLGLEEQKAIKSLNKISLGSYSPKLSEKEHVEVWTALFTLPQLDELEVVIKGRFSAKVKECASQICDSWKQSLPARQRLKSIQLMKLMTVNSTDFDFLSEICESHFIVNY